MKRYLIFGAVCLTMLSASISATTVAVAFPQIVSAFNTTLIVAGWVLGANILSSTVAMPLLGKISDAYGSRFTFILSIGLFTAGSLFCALAPNIELLIASRLVQGFGLGGLLPTGTSIVAHEFQSKRQQSIGLMSATFAVGPIIGPNLGGWLTTAFGWQSNFWIFVPFGLFALVTAFILVPKSKGDSTHLDLAGAGFLAMILAAVMSGISLMGNSQGQIPWLVIGILFAIAVALVVIFQRRQVRVINPIVDVQVLQEKRFLAANVYNMVLGFVMFGLLNFVPLYAVSIFGMNTFDSGFVMTPRSIGALVASTISSMLLVRTGYRRPMIAGALLTALSLIVLAWITPERLIGWPISSFMVLSLVLMVNGIAQGITQPAANNACIELMPDRIGTITGIRGMFRFIGSAIGINLTTLVLNNSVDIQRGFFLVLLGTAVVLVLSLPVILLIPKSASESPALSRRDH
jgi:EmrB/QacA subfamily drug resistance transporter